MKVERNKKKSVQGFKIGIVLKKALNVLENVFHLGYCLLILSWNSECFKDHSSKKEKVINNQKHKQEIKTWGNLKLVLNWQPQQYGDSSFCNLLRKFSFAFEETVM